MLRQCPITSFGLENFRIFIFEPILGGDLWKASILVQKFDGRSLMNCLITAHGQMLMYTAEMHLQFELPSVFMSQCASTVSPGIIESNQYLPLTA